MDIARRMADRFAGDDIKMRRLVTYWSATVLLYFLSISILWIEVRAGAAKHEPVFWLTVLAVAGHMLFYVLIRQCKRLNLTPVQLSVYQGRFAIVCTVAGYAMMGPLRGATLIILFVIVVFCAFTLEARKAHSLSIFAIILLGATMLSMRYIAPELFNAKTELIHFVLSGSMLLVVATLTGRLSELRSSLKAQKEELSEALAQIRILATCDELTSLPNRRYMGDLLQQEERRRQSDCTSACMAVLDLDWFKKINDVHGHGAGDEVLRKFAEEGRLNLRPCDVLSRWGGEEFLLYLPDTKIGDAKAVLERLRSKVQSLRFFAGGTQFSVTFSAGLIELLPDESVYLGIGRADDMLYRAKNEGRNRIAA